MKKPAKQPEHPKQLSFASYEFSQKKRATRREKNAASMDSRWSNVHTRARICDVGEYAADRSRE